jgi:hypothetical protein
MIINETLIFKKENPSKINFYILKKVKVYEIEH